MIVVVQSFNEQSHYTEVKSTFSDAIRSFTISIQGSKPIQTTLPKYFSGNENRKLFKRTRASEEVCASSAFSCITLPLILVATSASSTCKTVSKTRTQCFSSAYSYICFIVLLVKKRQYGIGVLFYSISPRTGWHQIHASSLSASQNCALRLQC